MSSLKAEEIPKLTFDQLIEHIRLSKVNAAEYVGLSNLLKKEIKLREPTLDYVCKNCSNEEFEEHQLRATGGFFSSILDLQTEKYRVISCARCKYSELYQGTTDAGQVAIDFLLGN